MLRPKQGKYVVKVTFDARQISKTKAQTEVMLLLNSEGEEGQFFCQSALRIQVRTVLVYTSKDGKEQLQANLGRSWRRFTRLRTCWLASAACATAPARTALSARTPPRRWKRRPKVPGEIPHAR